jgi:hypothetical protein
MWPPRHYSSPAQGEIPWTSRGCSRGQPQAKKKIRHSRGTHRRHLCTPIQREKNTPGSVQRHTHPRDQAAGRAPRGGAQRHTHPRDQAAGRAPSKGQNRVPLITSHILENGREQDIAVMHALGISRWAASKMAEAARCAKSELRAKDAGTMQAASGARKSSGFERAGTMQPIRGSAQEGGCRNGRVNLTTSVREDSESMCAVACVHSRKDG